MKWGVVLIDFSKYKENLSIDAFVSIVSKDIIKELDDATKNKLKKVDTQKTKPVQEIIDNTDSPTFFQ